jgi:hypothetical protein
MKKHYFKNQMEMKVVYYFDHIKHLLFENRDT